MNEMNSPRRRGGAERNLFQFLFFVFFAFFVVNSASALDVTFNVGDWQQNNVTNRTVIITPVAKTLAPPIPLLPAYDRLKTNSSADGSFTNRGMVQGEYRVDIQAPPDLTTFYIYVPINASYATNAYTMQVLPTNQVALGTGFAYSSTASDARYQPIGVPVIDSNTLRKTNNLSDVVSAATARGNIGAAGLADANIFSQTQIGTEWDSGYVVASVVTPSKTPLVAAGPLTNSGYTNDIFDVRAGGNTGANLAGANYRGQWFGDGSPLSGVLHSLQFFNTVYVSKNGNDSTGLRNRPDLPFLTMTAAKAASLPGDTGIVFPGLYAENNLLKSGVNWSFWPGVTISNTPSANDTNGFGIFDDRTTGATTNYIYGRPNLYYSTGTVSNSQAISNTCTVIFPPDNPSGAIEYFYQITNSMGAVVTTRSNTVLVAELGDITYYSTSQNSPLQMAAINISNCLYTSISWNRLINAIATNGGYVNTGDSNFSCFSQWLPIETDAQQATAVYWTAGECHLNFNSIDYFFQGIWANETATNTAEQDLWVNGDVMHSKIYQSGITTNFVGWYNVKTIDTTGYGNHYPPNSGAVSFYGGKEYLVGSEKVSAYIGPDVDCGSGATNFAWVNSQKLQMPAGNTGFFISYNSFTATNKLTVAVNEYEDVGGAATGIQNSAGNLYLQGGRMTLKNGIGISQNGGFTTVDGLTVDTSAGTGTNKWPTLVNAAGLKLKNATLLSPASTYVIYASTNTQVGVYNVAANNAIHPNIVAESAPRTNQIDYLQVRNAATISNLTITGGWTIQGVEAAVTATQGALIVTNAIVAKTSDTTEASVLLTNTSVTLDWSAGNVQYGVLATNVTFSFSNQTNGMIRTFRISNTASNYTVTWPSMKWPGGVAPTQTTGVHIDIYTILFSNGTNYGTYQQNY